jgi:hypothetical protein
VQTVVAFLIFFSIGLGIMWPAPLHPGSSVFGPVGLDLTGAISYYRSLAEAHLAPFLPGTVHAFNAPEGRPTQWALNFSTLPSSGILWLSSMAIGAVTTFTFWPIFTFALSALSMFLFARWLTGRWEAGFVAGLAWGFQPLVFTGQNQPAGGVFLIVLFVWRMFVTIERPTVRNGVWMGLACLLALMWVQYFLIIVGVAWAVLAVYALVIARARGEMSRGLAAQTAGAVPIVLGLGVILLAGIVSSFAGVPTRAASDLTAYAARPSMYLLPDLNNPFTGSITRGYVARHYPQSGVMYEDVYVGISVLVLAAAGLWFVGRVIRRRGLAAALDDRRVFVAIPLTVLAIVAFLFSMPPHLDIFGVHVPMPMDVIERVTTVFRTVARFALLVMLALCALLAITVSELVPKLRSGWFRLLVVAALAFVVTADLWARPPYHITRIRVPRVYRVLAQQPKGIYAEYPILPGEDFGGITYQAFYQGYAGDHDLFDGFFPGEAEEAPKMALEDLLDPQTEKVLAGYGVKYILVGVDEAGEAPHPYPKQGQTIPGARLIGRSAYGSLYRVTATPPLLSVALGNGFSPQEGSGAARWQWMSSPSATIVVTSRYRGRIRVRVRFQARALGPTRRIAVTDDRGRFVYRGEVSSTSGVVTFTSTISGSTSFRISSVPGPIPVRQLDPGSTDTRSLAIQAQLPVELKRLR